VSHKNNNHTKYSLYFSSSFFDFLRPVSLSHFHSIYNGMAKIIGKDVFPAFS
jgi:hypothetical protein